MDYRTGEQLHRFRVFVGVDVDCDECSSRFYDTLSYIEACNGTPSGPSGLPIGIEKVIVALLDRRQFKAQVAQDDAVAHVAAVLEAMPVELRVGHHREIEVLSSISSPGKKCECDVVTAYDEVLKESGFTAARQHYRKGATASARFEPRLRERGQGGCLLGGIARTDPHRRARPIQGRKSGCAVRARPGPARGTHQEALCVPRRRAGRCPRRRGDSRCRPARRPVRVEPGCRDRHLPTGWTLGSQVSQRGRYQLRSPSSPIAAGMMTKRTIVASTSNATATPNPICWKDTSWPVAKPAKTTMMISAAPVIRRAVEATPWTIPSVVLPVWW